VLMGDDGVGPAAIDALRRRGMGDEADLFDAGLAFSEVLCELEPDRPVIVLDALRGPGPPGSIYRLTPADLSGDGGSLASAVSLHEVNVLPALRMEALAGREFKDVTILGVEPDRVEWAEGLSPPVAAAMDKLVQAVARLLDERTAAPRTAEACGSNNA